MKLVIIESPFAGETEEDHLANVEYAERCLKDSLNRGEAPIASHLLYPRVLDDGVKEERKLGMEAGWAWMLKADLVAFYTDRGVSNGMAAGLFKAAELGVPVEERHLPKEGLRVVRD